MLVLVLRQLVFVVIGVNCTVLFACSGGAGERDANATEEDYAERERSVCVYVSARAVNARCDQEQEACDITRQLPGVCESFDVYVQCILSCLAFFFFFHFKETRTVQQ
jgi:hypothetical protein